MTRTQKRLFAAVKTQQERREFLALIRRQQETAGGDPDWKAAYLEKCRRVGAEPPEGI